LLRKRLKRKCKKNKKKVFIAMKLRKSFSKIKKSKEKIEEEKLMPKHAVRLVKILKTLCRN